MINGNLRLNIQTLRDVLGRVSDLQLRADLLTILERQHTVIGTLRLEASEYGAQNAPEFGTVTTPEGFATLRISDTYQEMQDGVAYPPVLISAGVNDPYAPVWHASKLAARLQAATAADHPILLRVDFGGGHALTTTQQASAERADVLAFLLYALGIAPSLSDAAPSTGRPGG